MNLFDYVKKYDYTFKEREFNEVDNLVFSILAYVDYKGCIIGYKDSLKRVANSFNKLHTMKEYKYDVYSVREGIKLLNICKNSRRYKNVLLSRYIYIGNDTEQFSAITFDINSDISYVAFEGTDNLVSGWFEDLAMCYMFPVPAQKRAIKYLNKYFTFSNKKLIVGGHSKGGNLALVASMYANTVVRKKIIKVYNNDGPGLMKKEIDSFKYKNIYDKYTHIIPYNSIVGILLRHDDFSESVVIDSNRPIILSHIASTWVIKDNYFVRRDISIHSKKIDKILLSWLNKYDYDTRRYFVEDIFSILRTNDIISISQLKKDYKHFISIIRKTNNISSKSKEMLQDLKKIIREIDKDKI